MPLTPKAVASGVLTDLRLQICNCVIYTADAFQARSKSSHKTIECS
jgi:hypothetical protein